MADANNPDQKPKPSRKKRRKNNYDPEEVAELEKIVFGDPGCVLESLETVGKYESDKKIKNDLLEDKKDETDDDEDETKSDRKKAAWVDSDDEDYSIDRALKEQKRKLPGQRPEKSYNELLERKFRKIVGTPKWAKVDKKPVGSDSDSDDDILKHSEHIQRRTKDKLPSGNIQLKTLETINNETRSEGPLITSIEFHPTSTVAFVAGNSGVISIFEVNGKKNTKLHSMQLNKFPVSCAKFIKEGSAIVAGSLSYPHCFTYDLITGKTLKNLLPHNVTNMKHFVVSPDGKMIAIKGRNGLIHVIDSINCETLFNLKMNRKCHALAFTADNKHLVTNGECNEMYVWDLNTRRCLNRSTDEGAITCASIAVSPTGQFLASGSKQGVVNIYDTNDVLTKTTPTPLKSVMNLVTSVTTLKFNPQSEILACASNKAVNAIKLVHLPSFTVFKNFPNLKTQLYQPTVVDFSPASGFFSIGNNKGFAYLYKVKHYGNY